MRTALLTAAMLLIMVPAMSFAARPTTIVFKIHAETRDGRQYAEFTVKCNDGRTVPLTAWDGLRKWCVGETGGGVCQKKQISAARTACMDT